MLYIIRHGKTDWNADNKLQGSADILLNEEGRKMAVAAGLECKDIHFDICYCSPLKRAKETAEIMLKGRNIEIKCDPRLTEMCFGEYEGISYDGRKNSNSLPADLNEAKDLNIANFFLKPEEYIADRGAESMDELFARTGSFLKEVIEPEMSAGRSVLIVGHGAMNCSLICQIKNYGYKDFWKEMTGNCKLMKVID